MALFNAAALVTGDGAVGLHVGEVLLVHAGRRRLRRPAPGPRLDRPRSLKHVEPLVGHFDDHGEAVALEVAADHALVEVVARPGPAPARPPLRDDPGPAVPGPALFGRRPALITETECSARGGRSCLYALSWEASGTDAVGRPGPGRTPIAARRRGRPMPIAVAAGPADADAVAAGARPDRPWTARRLRGPLR